MSDTAEPTPSQDQPVPADRQPAPGEPRATSATAPTTPLPGFEPGAQPATPSAPSFAAPQYIAAPAAGHPGAQLPAPTGPSYRPSTPVSRSAETQPQPAPQYPTQQYPPQHPYAPRVAPGTGAAAQPGPAQPGAAFGPAAAPPPPTGPGYASTATAPRSPGSPRKGSRLGLGIAAGLVVGALVGGGAGAGAAFLLAESQPTPVAASSDSGASTITVNNPQDAELVTSIAAVATPSVVTITALADEGGATGSGVVVDDEGHIVTNNHVATIDGLTLGADLTVQTHDGRLLPGTLVATDPMLDLAVIQVDGLDLPAIEFADSEQLNIGDVAVAIGAPLDLPGTVTSGVVSALDRGILVQSSAVPEESSEEVPSEESEGESPFDFWNSEPGNPGQPETPQQQTAQSSTISLPVIQTDAAINPGNSGGALVDEDGALIGINVAIAGDDGGNIGIGFSIPSNLVQRAVAEMLESGTVSHGKFGASVTNPTAAESSVAGGLLTQIQSGGPADAIGMQAGDVITEFDGQPITNATDLTAQVRALPAGTEVDFVYVRDGEEYAATVTLGELS